MKMWKVFWLSLIMSLFMVSCASAPQVAPPVGQVVEVSQAATAAGVMKAMAGAEGTMILRDSTSRFYLVVWDIVDDSSACFWVFDVKKVSAVNTKATIEELLAKDGNLTNIKDFKSLVEFLKGQGWISTTTAELSLGLRTMVTNYVSFPNRIMPTFAFLFVPVGFTGDPMADLVPVVNQ